MDMCIDQLHSLKIVSHAGLAAKWLRTNFKLYETYANGLSYVAFFHDNQLKTITIYLAAFPLPMIIVNT